jgi:hypothetical protein
MTHFTGKCFEKRLGANDIAWSCETGDRELQEGWHFRNGRVERIDDDADLYESQSDED